MSLVDALPTNTIQHSYKTLTGVLLSSIRLRKGFAKTKEKNMAQLTHFPVTVFLLILQAVLVKELLINNIRGSYSQKN